MDVGILITEGGPHSAGKLAGAYTKQLMRAFFGATEGANASQRRFEIKLLDIFEKHHEDIAAKEAAKNEAGGIDRLSDDIDPSPYIDKCQKEITVAAQEIGTVDIQRDGLIGNVLGKLGIDWTKKADIGAHMNKPDVQKELRKVIGNAFATNMDIQRSHHADKFAGNDIAEAYKIARARHGGRVAHRFVADYRAKRGRSASKD